MDETAFETLANQTLEDLFERLEDQLGDELEVDLEGGILTIELETGGQYVINRHAPNRQIWLSSPKSGAHHFGRQDDQWVSTRGNGDLLALLTDELGALTGTTPNLS